MCPSPRRCGVAQDPHRSEFTSVIYGFVLLLGTPTLVCVLLTPGCFSGPTPMLSTPLGTPQRLCSSGRLPTCCPQPGTPPRSWASGWQLSSLPSEPEEGTRGATQSLLESSAQPGLARALVTSPFLPVFSESFPPEYSWRIDCHTGSSCLCGGETPAAHLCLEPGRAGRQAPRGRPEAVCPCLAAGLPP